MSQPLIGITAGHGKNKYGAPVVQSLLTYINATINAGGVPIIIPPELLEDDWTELFSRLEGIIFTGGVDISPELSNGEQHPKMNEFDAARDAIEIPLMRLAVENNKPFLGICRGFQVLNVALGGTLYSHVEDQLDGGLKHDFYPDHPRNFIAHTVEITKSSRLAEIFGATSVEVNSLHHQGVKDIAPQLKATAYAPDRLIEGLELPDHPFGIATQWHPEWLQEYAPMRALFKAFVEAAKT